MSPIKKILAFGMLLLMGALLVVSCGTSNPNAVFDADTKSHPADWLPARHMTSAQANSATCEECHGADLSGGISQVSCTTCHLGGALSVHPATWAGDAILTLHGQYVVDNNSTLACANAFCHGTALEGVANSGPSCSSGVAVGCHSFP